MAFIELDEGICMFRGFVEPRSQHLLSCYNQYACRYKQLKKMLKACRDEDGTVSEIRESEFFTELREELKFVNGIFHRHAQQMVSRYQRSSSGLLSLIFWKHFRSKKHASKLADETYWCRKYARANAVALRKILKKHDKTCENRKGKEFFQECWKSTSSDGIGLFLHSPLLDELKAVQEKLQKYCESEVISDPNEDSKSVYPLHAQDDGGHLHNIQSLVEGKRGVDGPLSRYSKSSKSISHREMNGESSSHQALVRLSLKPTGNHDACHPDESDVPSLPPKSETSPSLKQQRFVALLAIEESPTCLLDSSDIEWEEDEDSPPLSAANGDPPKWPVLRNGKFEWDVQDDDQKKFELMGAGAPPGVDPDAPVSSAAPSQSKGSQPQSSGQNSSGVGPALGPFADEDLRCPICLEIMYRPVGLGCGHKFCRQCALEAAGFGRVVGAFRSIISYIPSRTCCPQCRQRDVYRGAVSLKQLSSLIKERYPELWAERKKQEKERMAQAVPRSSSSKPTGPVEILRALASANITI